MVSLDADDGGSGGLLAWVAAETLGGTSSFILARVLVGGMYTWTDSLAASRLDEGAEDLSLRRGSGRWSAAVVGRVR